MSMPELKLPETSDKAYICLSRFDQQGVIEHKNVSDVWVNDHGLLNVKIVGNDALSKPYIEDYAVEDVWGAWLDWPYKYFGNHRGQQRMGPEFFLDVVWNDWDWTEPNGSHRNRRLVNPVKSSIWCDGVTNDDEILIATVAIGFSGHYIIGWVRKNRLRSNNKVKSFHYPSMP